jgi:hypothetical protein
MGCTKIIASRGIAHTRKAGSKKHIKRQHRIGLACTLGARFPTRTRSAASPIQAASKMVAGSTARQYRAHDSIPVIYLRDQPGDSRPDLPVEDTAYRSIPFMLLAVGLVSLAFGWLGFTGFPGRPSTTGSGRRDTPGAGGNPSSRAEARRSGRGTAAPS